MNQEEHDRRTLNVVEGLFAYQNPMGFLLYKIICIPFKLIGMLIIKVCEMAETKLEKMEKNEKPSKSAPRPIAPAAPIKQGITPKYEAPTTPLGFSAEAKELYKKLCSLDYLCTTNEMMWQLSLTTEIRALLKSKIKDPDMLSKTLEALCSKSPLTSNEKPITPIIKKILTTAGLLAKKRHQKSPTTKYEITLPDLLSATTSLEPKDQQNPLSIILGTN